MNSKESIPRHRGMRKRQTKHNNVYSDDEDVSFSMRVPEN